MKFLKKLLYLFTTRERWQIAGIFILIQIGAGFETLEVGLVLSFIYEYQRHNISSIRALHLSPVISQLPRFLPLGRSLRLSGRVV